MNDRYTVVEVRGTGWCPISYATHPAGYVQAIAVGDTVEDPADARTEAFRQARENDAPFRENVG